MIKSIKIKIDVAIQPRVWEISMAKKAENAITRR
jgi:hypothetical protein